MYGSQLRKEQAWYGLPKLAGGWLSRPTPLLQQKRKNLTFFFFFFAIDKNSRINTWKRRGREDCKSSARQGSYHFSAGQNHSPRAVSLGRSTLCSSHTLRSASPEATPAAPSQLQVTNHHLSKSGSLPPSESQPTC